MPNRNTHRRKWQDLEKGHVEVDGQRVFLDLFFPVLVNDNHWCYVRIIPSRQKVFFFNPLGSRQEKPVGDLLDLFGELKANNGNTLEEYNWQVEVSSGKQLDGVNCGPLIVHRMFQIMHESFQRWLTTNNQDPVLEQEVAATRGDVVNCTAIRRTIGLRLFQMAHPDINGDQLVPPPLPWEALHSFPPTTDGNTERHINAHMGVQFDDDDIRLVLMESAFNDCPIGTAAVKALFMYVRRVTTGFNVGSWAIRLGADRASRLQLGPLQACALAVKQYLNTDATALQPCISVRSTHVTHAPHGDGNVGNCCVRCGENDPIARCAKCSVSVCSNCSVVDAVKLKTKWFAQGPSSGAAAATHHCNGCVPIQGQLCCVDPLCGWTSDKTRFDKAERELRAHLDVCASSDPTDPSTPHPLPPAPVLAQTGWSCCNGCSKVFKTAGLGRHRRQAKDSRCNSDVTPQLMRMAPRFRRMTARLERT